MSNRSDGVLDYRIDSRLGASNPESLIDYVFT